MECPICTGSMHLVSPHQGQTWRPFWGCDDYPECRGSFNIKRNGIVETFDEWDERQRLLDDWAAASYDDIHYRD